jgi:hypothetical protein
MLESKELRMDADALKFLKVLYSDDTVIPVIHSLAAVHQDSDIWHRVGKKLSMLKYTPKNVKLPVRIVQDFWFLFRNKERITMCIRGHPYFIAGYL